MRALYIQPITGMISQAVEVISRSAAQRKSSATSRPFRRFPGFTGEFDDRAAGDATKSPGSCDQSPPIHMGEHVEPVPLMIATQVSR